MNTPLNRFSTLIWLALVMLTIVTFCIGEEVSAGKAVMLSVLVISLIKGGSSLPIILWACAM